MERRRIPHLAVVALALALLLTILLIRRGSAKRLASLIDATPMVAPVIPVKVAPPVPPALKAPVAQDKDFADPNEVVDPAKVLRGELLVRVLTTDGKPIAGAKVIPNLRTNAWDGEEGILSDDLWGGGGYSWISGKNAIFRGEMGTNADGVALLQVFLPRQEKYLNGYLGITVEAPLFVERQNQGQLRLPKEGERKEITFKLQPGQILRGKILNLEKDDPKHLHVYFCLPGEEEKQYKTWGDLAELQEDGSFETEPAPLVPLVLKITHHGRKYRPYTQTLNPPFPPSLEIVLQRDATFKEMGRAVFTIKNPPAKGEFSHVLKIYIETEKRVLGITSNHSELTQKMELRGGAYRVLLCSWDQDVPMWAHAEFTVTDTGTTEVPLTLEKAATVRVRIKDKASGAAVQGENMPSLDLEYKFGDKYEHLYGLVAGYGKTKTGVPGESQFVTIPPGPLRLVVTDHFKRRYRDCPQVVTLASGEAQTLDFLLEPAAAEKDR